MARIWCILTIILFIPLGLEAREVYFQTLGSVQGMSQSSAISIWQDHLGRMWLGNDALNCYDGETVEVYRLSDYIKGIEDANLHTITGNDSILFVIAETQLIRFNLKQETFELLDIQTTSVFYADGFLYYFSAGSFCRYNVSDRRVEEVMLLPPEIALVRDIESCGENRFFIATPSGGYILDVKAKQIVERLLPGEDLLNLMTDSHDNIWITTQRKHIYIASHVQSASLELVPVSIRDERIQQTDIYCLAEDINGSVWLGTISGLFQVNRPGSLYGNNLETLNYVMPESSVYALYSDRQGTLWIGSYSGDVRYFNPEVDNYLYYRTDEDHPDRLHGAVIGDIAEDKAGNLYITTEGSGINIYDPSTDKFTHLKVEDGLRHNKISCLWYDAYYDRVFFGEYMRGISWYDPKTKRVHNLESKTLSKLYHHIIESIIPYRRYLILLTQDGLFRLDRETLEISELFKEPELQTACSGIIRSIHIDERDVMWVSSFERGLFTIDMKTRKIKRYYGDGLQEESIIPSAILNFVESPQKGLFLITLKSGLLFYEPESDRFLPINAEQQHLLSNICYRATFTHYGNLIVTTNKGVTILNTSARGRVNVLHHYRLSSSFPLGALNGDCGLYSSPNDDRIYIGGLYGLFSFSEKDLGVGRDNYSLYFSSLWVNNRLISPSSGVISQTLPHTDKLVLPYHRNTLNLTFASTNYLSTRNAWHEYKMEGLEEMWTATNHKNIIFNSLRPGKYKLLLREVGNESRTAELAIVIKPPFWATTPLLITYFVLFVVLLWSIIRFSKSKTSLLASLEVEREEYLKVEEANRKKTDFFINISNEFRTPLTLIMSQLERLSVGLPSKEKKRLEKIGIQTRRLQDLIAELIDFRKMEDNDLQLHVASYNLNDFLKTIYTTYMDVAEEKQVNYRYLPLSQSVEIWFDRKQMQKVIYNLHTFIFNYARPKDHIDLVAYMRNKWMEIQVVYDGALPENEWMDYLFELINEESVTNPNLSLLPEGGMGLAFSKGIVYLHKGRISVGKEGTKTCFLICIPLGNSHFSTRELESVPESLEQEVWDNPPAEPVEPVVPEAVETSAEGIDPVLDSEEKTMRLLLVDTDDEMRSLLKESFSFLYEVIECTHTEEAYAFAEAEQPDLIVTEMNVPGMNGAEFCQALKSNIKTLHIPVVVLSSQPSEKQKTDCIRSGADAYIVKPFNLEFLLLRCNSLVKYRKKILRRDLNLPVGGDELDMTTNVRDKNFILRANQVIEENISNPDFDTTFWSKALGISRTRLFTQIKDITGLTPNDYILHLKMDRGLSLLNETPLTIAEIAYKLGFSIPAYFSKCFKKQFGITPAEYRRSQGGKTVSRGKR